MSTWQWKILKDYLAQKLYEKIKRREPDCHCKLCLVYLPKCMCGSCICGLKVLLSEKLSGDGQIFQLWPYLNLLIIIKLPFSQQEHVQIFPLPWPSKTWETRKISSIISMTYRIIWTRSSTFCFLIDMYVYKQNLLVCNSGQHTYVSGFLTFSLFFKIWLTELILFSRKNLFRGTCFLSAFNTLSFLRHK